VFSDAELRFVLSQRVAHFATVDAPGWPHVVPVCFTYVGGCFWVAVDEKPKRTSRLKRLRNIEENANVALLFDRYDDDWRRLAYVLVRGAAAIVPVAQEQPQVLEALRERYAQYAEMRLEERPLIRVRPERVVSWGDL